MSLAISGQKAVTTAGTEEALGNMPVNGPMMVKALTTNTGLIYLGKAADGTVASSSGFVLSAGQEVAFNWVANLSSLMVDSAVNGEGVCWILLNV